MVHTLPPEAFLRMPWKNGGGETLQLAIHPSGAGLDNFAWRISSARVASSGPFSSFPGVDRSLALLSGFGLNLSAPAVEFSAPLRADGQVVAFPGEWSVHGELSDAADEVVDFNVMTRRNSWTHSVCRHFLTMPLRLPPGLYFGWVLAGGLRIADAAGTVLLPAGHAFIADQEVPCELLPAPQDCVSGGVELWLVELRPALRRSA